MTRPSLRLARGIVVAIVAIAAPAVAGTYQVPTGAYPTLQSAVDAAAASLDAQNFVHIGASPLFTSAAVTIGNAFNAGHTLTIRPVPSLRRAFIASQNGSQRIFNILTAGSVRIQDLDIVRFSTNNNDLIFMDTCFDILIERCRIGSVWTSVGTAGPWGNVVISYPTRVTLRNCVVFSHMFGNFDHGIRASLADDENSLYLYNNDVSDYSEYGIEVAAPMAGQVVKLINNVVVNHPDAVVEPVTYHSVVDALVTLMTESNVAFAGAGNVERNDDDQLISGAPGVTFQRLPRDQADDSFMSIAWNVGAGWNMEAHRNYYRLNGIGKLHNQIADFGKNDGAVMDDWERDARPSGPIPQHTDRGADQIEIGTTGVDAIPVAAGLWAAPLGNPAREVGVQYRAERAGALDFSVFDLAGRLLHREAREVASGAEGVFAWDGAPAGQVLLYRLRLDQADDGVVRTGRIVVLR